MPVQPRSGALVFRLSGRDALRRVDAGCRRDDAGACAPSRLPHPAARLRKHAFWPRSFLACELHESHQLSSLSMESILPMISTSASRALGVLLFFRFALDLGAGVSSSGAGCCSAERMGVGARISGGGPEKSLPVMRDSVSISA